MRLSRSLVVAASGLVVVVIVAAAYTRSGGKQVTPFEADAVPPAPLVTQEDRAHYVGSDACKECHTPQFDAHAGSLHSQTLFPADDPRVANLFKTDQVLKDPVLGVTYSFAVEQGQPVTKVRGGKNGALDLKPAYALGSGKYGVTPVYERSGVYLEGRASYYPPMKKWYWTPGQQVEAMGRQEEGRILPRDETVQCFLCHGTAIVQTEDQPISPQSLFQVGCERCHGAGREHVEAAKRGKKGGGLFTYSKASPGTVMHLCSECHRRPTDSAVVNLETDPNLPRFAGTALAASKCFKSAPDRLTCTTCHDPHSPVSTGSEAYERVCLSCHTSGEKDQKPCPVKPKSGCIPCHMPAQSINFPGGAKFHNHWIKPYPKNLVQAFELKRTVKPAAR